MQIYAVYILGFIGCGIRVLQGCSVCVAYDFEFRGLGFGLGSRMQE